ncbi:DUF4402 domain-containing protein [Salegentibacter sp. F188]|uniref:DUF4402 domain-containing protein n=1 Tax=Autumnicola patrickiae TaxID=3075591 RepID=A0ABU3E2I2_9FLAO|nr:DUF4402 domain-containing protein [Salegentibacter sp. F188]MDT0690130.1 DUF4402 domain-containing protein [Salegentibacter sp. F188]
MKKAVVFFFLLSVFFPAQIFAQASASATVISRVTVIDPIEVHKTADLDFGNVISAYNPGSIILAPDGSRTAIGVQISTSLPGNVTPAEAEVTHGNNSYAITLPESYTLYNTENPNQAVILDDFTVEPIPGNGIDLLRIGATLNLEANQFSGLYSNPNGFNVTVSYN